MITVISFCSCSEGAHFASLRASSAAHSAYPINLAIDLLSYERERSKKINSKHSLTHAQTKYHDKTSENPEW